MATRTSKEIGEELRKWMKARGATGQSLAEAVSIENPGETRLTQSWISRICNGKFKVESRQVKAVLSYAGIRTDWNVEPEPGAQLIIAEAVADVWDGSRDNARAIARLLRSANGLAARTRTGRL